MRSSSGCYGNCIYVAESGLASIPTNYIPSIIHHAHSYDPALRVYPPCPGDVRRCQQRRCVLSISISTFPVSSDDGRFPFSMSYPPSGYPLLQLLTPVLVLVLVLAVLDSQHEDPCIITSTISSYSPVFVTTTRTITVIATDVASGASDANQARLQALA
ncbi:hypothetical protein L227DRAFT_577402 [Lentinus tigrinus ALCF2SS1-6]|uniref:Uncharacterized protein n=1 Tax=Lentinus tigrinus ALCF2SS1-6 TaxID=1328759 RepID=A0A5C2S9M6_9APHY|nr:hypothetical protein L227DRAFT_577402 [Lentinus tigrinus ALCF2SS1-6]